MLCDSSTKELAGLDEHARLVLDIRQLVVFDSLLVKADLVLPALGTLLVVHVALVVRHVGTIPFALPVQCEGFLFVDGDIFSGFWYLRSRWGVCCLLS